MRSRILILDDVEGRHAVLRERYPSDDLVHAHDSASAISALRQGPRFDVVFLDHDLGEDTRTGLDVARAIADLPEDLRPLRVIVHSHNPVGGEAMRDVVMNAGIPCVLEPFSGLRPR